MRHSRSNGNTPQMLIYTVTKRSGHFNIALYAIRFDSEVCYNHDSSPSVPKNARNVPPNSKKTQTPKERRRAIKLMLTCSKLYIIRSPILVRSIYVQLKLRGSISTCGVLQRFVSPKYHHAPLYLATVVTAIRLLSTIGKLVVHDKFAGTQLFFAVAAVICKGLPVVPCSCR